MGRSRRADAVVFGFDFQINAAIVLFLENVKNAKSLRLEGDYEDIEIEMDNGEYILAQAKAVERASDDFANVRANMKKAITTLSEGSHKTNAKELIMVTNSPNPFNDDSKSAFYGPSKRFYKDLPKSAKEKVDGYLKEVKEPLDVDKFKVQVIPFETDEDAERYKIIKQCIDDFVGELNTNTVGLGIKLLDVWHRQVFDNGGKHNATIKLNKKEIVWPILVKVTEDNGLDEEFRNQFDIGLLEEVRNRYADIIENHCERCEHFIKILSGFNSFQSKKKPIEKINDFIEKKWNDYSNEFSSEIVEDEVKEAITKIVIYKVLRQRYAINHVKERTNI